MHGQGCVVYGTWAAWVASHHQQLEASIRRAAVLSLAAVLLSGCSLLGIGGSVGPNEWWLTATTPDGQQLLVTSTFGGVASGCSRWEDWQVDTTAERVEVTALLWRKHRPSSCTDDAAARTLLVDLAGPLGDRALDGCERDDCRTEPFPGWLGGDPARVVLGEDGVVVSDGSGLRSFDPDGGVRWEMATSSGGELLATSGVVVTSDGSGASGWDAVSGERRWRTSGYPIAAGGGVVVTCTEDETIRGLEAVSGVERWTAAVPCGPAAVSGTTVAVVAADPEVDGGHELVLLDLATGQVALRRDLDDGVDDRVAAFSGVLADDDRFVVSGTQADLVVLDTAGTELVRVPSVEGHPVGVADGVVVLASHNRVTGAATDDGTELWSLPTDPAMAWAVAGSAVLLLDGPTGALSHIDARTGQSTWTTPVGVSTTLAAAGGTDGPLYIKTVLALLVVNHDTGNILSWTHTPPDADDVHPDG